MTALSEDTLRRDPTDRAGVRSLQLRASQTLYQGSLVAHRVGNSLVDVIDGASPRSDLIIVGVAVSGAASTASVDSNSGAIDANSDPINVNYQAGVRGEFDTGTGANEITANHVGMVAYAYNDNTLYLTSLNDSLSPAGIVHSVDNVSGLVTIRIPEESLIPYVFGMATTSTTLATTMGRVARGVVYNNQADLTAFTVASDDGVTYVEGDTLLLTGQTTTAQNGPYVVGAVATGAAPLSRPSWWQTGDSIQNGCVIEVSEGTWYAGSSWKAMCTGAKVVGTSTHDPLFYPRSFKGVFTLSSGTYTIGFGSTATPDEPLFLFSTTKSSIQITRDTHAGTIGTDGYEAPVATLVAGKHGTAVIVVNATNENGGTGSSDTSTIKVLVSNW